MAEVPATAPVIKKSSSTVRNARQAARKTTANAGKCKLFFPKTVRARVITDKVGDAGLLKGAEDRRIANNGLVDFICFLVSALLRTFEPFRADLTTCLIRSSGQRLIPDP